MKKTKNSPTKRIAASAMMLAVSAAMLGTSTYAWFTMNKEVTVTGMEVKTTVGDNLLIANDTLANKTKLADSNFKTADVDVMAAVLEPVSTINGSAFYYTDSFNVAGNGDAISNIYKAYSETQDLSNTTAHKDKYDTGFQTNYGITSGTTITTGNVMYGYVDYVFQLKANNTSDSAMYLNVTDITLANGNLISESNSLQAFRAAIFSENITSGSITNELPANLITLLSTEDGVTGGRYFTDKKAINATTGEPAAIADVTGKTGTSAYNADASLGSVGAGATGYYKVVVRLWIEGEDENCTNTVFNTLTDDWALSLKIEMKDAATGSGKVVNHLTGTAVASKVALVISTDTLTTTGDSVKNISGQAFYPIGTKKLNDNQLYTTDNPLTTTSRVYTIADGTHPIDVTNLVTISA